MLNWIDPLNDSNVPVEDLFVVVVLRLDNFVAYLESPREPLDAVLATTNRIQAAFSSRTPSDPRFIGQRT